MVALRWGGDAELCWKQLPLLYTLENEGIQSSIFMINIIQPQVLRVTFSGLPKGRETSKMGTSP